MDRAKEFIKLFNKLDKHLRKLIGTRRHQAFHVALHEASQVNATVRRYRDILQSYSRLRNVIVHDENFLDKKIIAEPTPATVKELHEIVNKVVIPQKVIPRFKREVKVWSSEEFLLRALLHMNNNDFSQIVVRVDNSYRLLTLEGFARWVEAEEGGDVVFFSEATLMDALVYDPENIFEIVGEDTTVDEVLDLFTTSLYRGIPRFCAVLITETDSTGKPLGMVTPWDLLNI